MLISYIKKWSGDSNSWSGTRFHWSGEKNISLPDDWGRIYNGACVAGFSELKYPLPSSSLWRNEKESSGGPRFTSFGTFVLISCSRFFQGTGVVWIRQTEIIRIFIQYVHERSWDKVIKYILVIINIVIMTYQLVQACSPRPSAKIWPIHLIASSDIPNRLTHQ